MGPPLIFIETVVTDHAEILATQNKVPLRDTALGALGVSVVATAFLDRRQLFRGLLPAVPGIGGVRVSHAVQACGGKLLG